MTFEVQTKELGHVDVAVCGAGIAGVCAAVSAARNGASVVLIERGGSLGGTLTEGAVSYIIDSANKGGIVRELFAFLNAHQMTCARIGKKVDESGNRVEGPMVDIEGVKYFFDKLCEEAGVEILYFSQVSALKLEDDRIQSILVTTECGNYSLSADLYIDATGNGTVADLAGCGWECGDPVERRPSPATMSAFVMGFPREFDGVDTGEQKSAYANMLLKHGIDISAQQALIVKQPSLRTWSFGVGFQYNVIPDDIRSLTKAVVGGRKETFETVQKHKKIEGYEELHLVSTSSHIGLREGRRIFGQYRLRDEDIIEGRRFEDGICLVTMTVDVHKLDEKDTISCQRGIKTKPYHIPYRCLVAKECKNLLLAGRLISGDFYPHASYRVMGNMAATGEAAGYAAACCVKDRIWPAEFDGRKAGAYMKAAGYEL